MAANRLDAVKAPEEARGGEKSPAPAAARPRPGGGIKPWLPLLANVLLMPALAYGVTTFLLIPKIAANKTETTPVSGGAAAIDASATKPARTKISAPLAGKILVNIAETAGTRYLVASITLVGKRPDLKAQVDQNDAELRDAASSILSGKTISDLEKPGVRNLLRAELMAAFNDILGKDTVNEIYLTEFAIQ